MASERRGLWLTTLLAVGAAGVVFASLPGAWPNPLPQGPLDADAGVPRLQAAARAVDAACTRGDVAAFVSVVTDAHRDRLARELSVVDRRLDGSALRDLGARGGAPYGAWLAQPFVAGEVRGARAAVAVQRPAGDGVQVLSFVWDGRVLRLDDSRHSPQARSAATARAAVADAVLRRAR
jgi:hypothetical protein